MSGPGATPAVRAIGVWRRLVLHLARRSAPTGFHTDHHQPCCSAARLGNLPSTSRVLVPLISPSAFRAAAHVAIVALGFLAGNAFACKPAPWGTGSYPTTSTGAGQPHADGEWAYWFCQSPYKTTWEMRLRKTGAPIVIPSLKDKTAVEAFDAIEAANITLSLDDPSLANLKAAAMDHLIARIPPGPRWTVAKNGTTTTRPVYARNEDGTLGALDKSVRADVGAECQCSEPGLRVVSGTSTYCAFRVEPPVVVTLCKPAQ